MTELRDGISHAFSVKGQGRNNRGPAPLNIVFMKKTYVSHNKVPHNIVQCMIGHCCREMAWNRCTESMTGGQTA